MERYDLPAEKLANEQEAGMLRIASETDEKNCGCVDAAVTPNNLYSLLDYRKKSTAYTAGAIVACPYHKEFLLKCTTGGTTSANSLDTTSVTKGGVITDGSVKWTVIASQIIDLSISGKTITVTFVDGTQKTLTTQDTVPTAYVIEKGSNYRKYSDGFIEQWGFLSDAATASNSKRTVTFPKTFTTTTYAVVITPRKTTPAATVDGTLQAVNPTTTNFQIYSNWYSNKSETIGFYWYVCGY